jgi:hypothetical protein
MVVPYVVLVTGSRFWDNTALIKEALDQAVADAVTAGYPEFVLRHGKAYPPFSARLGRRPWRSADYLAHLWFQHTTRGPLPIPVMVEQERPADWDAPCRPACQGRTHRGRTVDHRITRPNGHGNYCPDAGKIRNRDMALEDPRPTVGVAFHRDNSSGTAHCIRTMRELSIPVLPITYQEAA